MCDRPDLSVLSLACVDAHVVLECGCQMPHLFNSIYYGCACFKNELTFLGLIKYSESKFEVKGELNIVKLHLERTI